jgi:hypothetical protein
MGLSPKLCELLRDYFTVLNVAVAWGGGICKGRVAICLPREHREFCGHSFSFAGAKDFGVPR